MTILITLDDGRQIETSLPADATDEMWVTTIRNAIVANQREAGAEPFCATCNGVVGLDHTAVTGHAV